MNSDGSGEVFFTEGCDPAWSPDGQKIAFYNEAVLSTSGVDGMGITDPGHVWTENLVWSPDGNYIVYMSWGDALQYYVIHFIHVDGTGEADMTDNPAQDVGADWGSASTP